MNKFRFDLENVCIISIKLIATVHIEYTSIYITDPPVFIFVLKINIPSEKIINAKTNRKQFKQAFSDLAVIS
jgi:hypothetical protein